MFWRDSVVTKDKDIFELMICLLHKDMFPQLKGYQDKASWCEGYLQQTWSKNISKEDFGQIFYPHRTTSTRSRKCWFFSNKFNLFLKYKFSKIISNLVTWDLMNVTSYIQTKASLCFLYKKGCSAKEIYSIFQKDSSSRKGS